MEKRCSKVCVTGGAGYLGSSLVKSLLEEGHIVHATLRNLEDQSKVGLLRSFPNADTRLELFEADLYKPEEFEKAIEGCDFVFHVASPMFHSEGSVYNNNRVEATVAATKSITVSCMKSGTVRRLIYTASVVAASPLKDDGTGYKGFMDETCWTPLDLSIAYSNDFMKGYKELKTLAEKEILSTNNDNGGELEVVTLPCGLVGGDTYLSYTPMSVSVILSQITNSANEYQFLKFLEELIGKVPLVHVEDVCVAHIFCMNERSITGRFLCASSYVSSAEIANHYHKNYPEFHLKQEYLDERKRDIDWHGTKLTERGFTYKYDTKKILDDCITCARKMGDLQP